MIKTWLLRIAVILSLLTVLLFGGWCVWRRYYAREHLAAAIRDHDMNRVRWIVALSADVNAEDGNGFNRPLDLAVDECYTADDSLKMYLFLNAEGRKHLLSEWQQDASGLTPSQRPPWEICKVLTAAGAELSPDDPPELPVPFPFFPSSP